MAQSRNHASGFRARAELHRQLVAAFAGRPEITGVYAFGREVDGQVDEYSDLDVIVCSADLAATQSSYMGILSGISPVMGSYYIVCSEGELVQMVMLRDYSPYQKIDLSICRCIDQKQAFGPFKCLFSRAGSASGAQTSLSLDGQRQAMGNWLNDVLFSIPRFTKCLFRRDRDMYRRWNGAVESLAVLLYDRHAGWSREHRYRLMPQEYKVLHKHLSDVDRARLDAILPFDRDPNLADGYNLAVNWIVELYAEKAAALGERLDLTLAETLCEFLAQEIARHRRIGASRQRRTSRLNQQDASWS